MSNSEWGYIFYWYILLGGEKKKKKNSSLGMHSDYIR